MRKYLEATNIKTYCDVCKREVSEWERHMHILAGIGHPKDEPRTEFRIDLPNVYLEEMRICKDCIKSDLEVLESPIWSPIRDNKKDKDE